VLFDVAFQKNFQFRAKYKVLIIAIIIKWLYAQAVSGDKKDICCLIENTKSKLTIYLEDIALLQRGTGECLITLATRPDISKEIIANCGILVSFQNHIQKDIMCELLNIDIEKKNYLSKLDEGQCIIRVNFIKEPFLLKVPLIKRKSLKGS